MANNYRSLTWFLQPVMTQLKGAFLLLLDWIPPSMMFGLPHWLNIRFAGGMTRVLLHFARVIL